MPKRRLTIHACLTGFLLAGTTMVNAEESPWRGSYVANGQCFCAGPVGQEIDSQIVPTPVGGQSVTQVCARIDSGPELQKVNGKFNFTVYEDRQCGHGPLANSRTARDCLGHRGVSGEDCEGIGPKWDLASAYSNSDTPEPGIYNTPSANGTSRYIKPQTKKSTNNDAANTSVAEIAATRESSVKIARATPPVFKPQIVTPPIDKKPVPQTREQIRARQLVQMAAARKRALTEDTDSVQPTASNETPAFVSSPDLAAAKTDDVATVAEVVQDTKKKSIEAVANSSKANADKADIPLVNTALKSPLSLTRGSAEFDYVEAAPVRFDFGGAGLRVAASKSSHNRLQYVMRAGLADTYQEVALGLGYFVTPQSMPRFTFLLNSGLESGRFKFREDDLEANLSDTGAFLQATSRFAVTRKLKVQGGMSYSSFFEGDLIGFGEALLSLTSDLDLSTRVEAGDNDMIGFGIRYHY